MIEKIGLKKLVLVSISFVLFSGLTPVQAAVLYLEPAQGEYQSGDTFMVDVRIDTEDECINTVEANLSFSQALLKAVDFSQGNSILTLWVTLPSFNQEAGLISFSGGIPGGYCGQIPGDIGESNLLGKIIFRVVPREVPGGSAEVVFRDDSQVLLNDGLGTPAKLTTKGAIFEILEKTEILKDEWQEELEKDNIPPEPFKIEINQDPAIFEGKYFITFSTTDKQTGIDYFEVAEVRPGAEPRGMGRGTTLNWKKGDSPYLLENQDLKSIIKVRAVDKAGNERIAEYLPPQKPFPYWIIIPVIIGLVIIGWLIKKWKTR